MLKITYKEYLKYEELYAKEKEILEVREESASYTYDTNNEHDKVFRDVLSIKEEALSLINKALKPREEIKEEISLVDINNYTKEELLEEKNILSKVMLLEKSKNEAEFIENVKEVLENADDRNINKLKDIIIYKAYDALKKEELEEMLNKIKNKKEESIMTLGERIRRNEKEERMKARNEGRKEGKIEGIINLIKLNVDEEIISKAMQISKKEIEKIKTSMIN